MNNNIDNISSLISVITITYNASKEVPPTLESLNNQSFKNFEHIVIDGASTDGTPEIIQRMSPDSLLISEPDKGLYDAMNKGLARARGRYVLFMNAGDTFHHSDTLSQYADAINNAPFIADIVYGDTVIVDNQRHIIAPRHKSAPEILNFKSFLNGMLVCHQSFMVRRDIAPEYNLQYRFSADYDWTIRCIKASDPLHNINLNTVVTDYLSEGLTDKNHKASLIERFKIMCKYYGLFPTIAAHIRFLIHH